MKLFLEMSQEEINAMTKEEFTAVPSEEKRSCYDCGWLKSALSWWCSNKEAKKARGTSLPGVIKCRYWKPEKRNIEIKNYQKSSEGGIWKKIKKFFCERKNHEQIKQRSL